MLSSSNVPDVPGIPDTKNAKYQGFGGFPGPAELVSQVVKITAPHAYQKLERSMTITTMTTLQASSVPWLNFSGLVVGRNSDFRIDSLTDEQLEDIGGAEYKALRLLSYLVPAVLTSIFSFNDLVGLNIGCLVHRWVPAHCCSVVLALVIDHEIL
jgi:hypothetical protein